MESDSDSASESDANQERWLTSWSQRRRDVTVTTLKYDPLVIGLAAWHSFGLWLSMTAVVITGVNFLLKRFVDWYELVVNELPTDEPRGDVLTVGLFTFLGLLFTAHVLISLLSELVRTSFLLVRDAWRDDAFEAYRRLMVGFGEREFQSCKFYTEDALWPEEALQWRYRSVDALVQVVIYFTLDILPLIFFVRDYRMQGQEEAAVVASDYDSKSAPNAFLNGIYSALEVLVAASLSHVLVLFLARLFYDVHFKWSCLAALLFSEDPTLFDSLTQPCDASHDDTRSSSQYNVLNVRNKLNLCRGIHRFFNILLPHCVWIACFLIGLRSNKIGFIALGGGLGFILLFGQSVHHCCRASVSKRRALVSGRGRWTHWAIRLQRYADSCCGLDQSTQLAKRLEFIIIVFFFSVTFAHLEWTYYIGSMLFLMVVNLFLQSASLLARPWAWVFGFAEAVVLGVLCPLVVFVCWPREAYGECLLLLVISMILRQCGLDRPFTDGIRVGRATTIFLSGFVVALVFVVLGSIDTRNQLEESIARQNITNLAEESLFTIPFQSPNKAKSTSCSLSWAMGSTDKSLSLVDFGLFSQIVYQDGTRAVDSHLQFYFPHWRIEEAHFTDHDSDWSTYFHFSDPTNSTHVIAVQGTHSFLDALHDANIWAPVVVIMMFNSMGPSISVLVSHAVAWLSASLNFLQARDWRVRQFNSLIEYVRHVSRTKRPDQTLYLTGHSLGGGIAKLVSAVTGVHAITFNSPALAVTNYVVFGKWFINRLRRTTLTVQSDNDIVSRIDTLTGTVVPVPCVGGPGVCHAIANQICSLYELCGASNGFGKSRQWPCGSCYQMPCKS